MADATCWVVTVRARRRGRQRRGTASFSGDSFIVTWRGVGRREGRGKGEGGTEAEKADMVGRE